MNLKPQPSKLRQLTREQRRELARSGAAMTAAAYQENPKEVLPDLVDLIALHEAINRPKGIVPHEAEEFYDQDFYSNNSAQ